MKAIRHPKRVRILSKDGRYLLSATVDSLVPESCWNIRGRWWYTTDVHKIGTDQAWTVVVRPEPNLRHRRLFRYRVG